MEDIKYTKDGRKVKVISQVNKTQFVCQEIFVKDGIEFASGDNFVEEGLLDAAVESWKEKKIRELEESFELKQAKLKTSINAINKEISSKIPLLKQFSKGIDEMFKKSGIDGVGRKMIEILDPTYEYVVVGIDSSSPRMYNKEDFITKHLNYEGKLKLVTLFGRTSGDLKWKVNSYPDGSGSFSTDVRFFKSEEDAKEAISMEINSKEVLYIRHVLAAKELGIQLDAEKIKPLIVQLEDKKAKQLARIHEQFATTDEQIADLKSLLKL